VRDKERTLNAVIRAMLTLLVVIAAPAGCASSVEPPPALAASVGPASEPATAPTEVDAEEEPWSFAAYPGQLLRTPNYVIYTTINYENILRRLPLFMERALAQYRTALGDLPAPPEAMETYIFRDRRQWQAKTREMLPEHADSFNNLGRGGFSTHGVAVLYYIDWRGRFRDTFAIAAHEGWHQYTQRTFRQSLPVWLEEGVATYMEGYRYRAHDTVPIFEPHRNGERRRALREALRRDKLIPLDSLLSDPPQEFLEDSKDALLTYYAQVWALTHFLAEGADGGYRQALEEVLQDAASGALLNRLRNSPVVVARGGRRRVMGGRLGPWVVLAYFNRDLAAFEQEYLDYVRVLANGGANRSPRRR
jgi:hypothetical protein